MKSSKGFFRYSAKVLKILDGDTVDLSIDVGFDIWVKKTCRILGIDTLEIRSRNKKQKMLALKAKERVEDLLSPYDTVEIITHREQSKYGRYLVDIKVGKDLVSKVLRKEKLAVSYEGQNKKELKKAHEANLKYWGNKL